jgi:hypothetical protein
LRGRQALFCGIIRLIDASFSLTTHGRHKRSAAFLNDLLHHVLESTILNNFTGILLNLLAF